MADTEMRNNAYCKTCGKALIWVDTNDGKRIALDPESRERRYVLDANTDPMRAAQRNTYTCHFDTCSGGRS